MARIQKPPAGRLVVSVIYSSMDALADGLKALERKYGRVQCETLEIPCSDQKYYGEEMGENLLRRLFSFSKTIKGHELPQVKSVLHKMETRFADQVNQYLFRSVNLDPGILTPGNLVMCGHRELNHRIYLGDGVYSELTLIHSGGEFNRLPWTNSDFCHDEAIDMFNRLRDSFELVEENPTVITS